MEEFDVLKEEVPTDVYINASFIKIHDIDTINQRFQAELLIEMRWHDSTLKSTKDYQSIEWKPDIYVENAVNETKNETSLKIFANSQNLLMVSEIRHVRGVFHENLELENFPLDVQDLTVCICSKKSGRKVNLIQTQPASASVKISHTLDKSAWYLHDEVTAKKDMFIREYSFGQREYPVLYLSCKAFRQPGYFFWNAMLPIALISFAALGPFVLDHKSSVNRLPSTATMLLSSVSFKAAVTRLLPTVSYLTSLDKYSLSSIVCIACMFIYHSFFSALSHLLYYETLAYLVDKLAFLFFLAAVVGIHAVYGVWLMNVYNHRRNLMSKIDMIKSVRQAVEEEEGEEIKKNE